MFFVGPGIIYVLDKIISLRTSYVELDIIETELLPSDVVKVKFYRSVLKCKYINVYTAYHYGSASSHFYTAYHCFPQATKLQVPEWAVGASLLHSV